MQSAAITLLNVFCTVMMLVCPSNMLTAAEQCSGCMHTKHLQHCHVHAYQTHATWAAGCIPNTCNIWNTCMLTHATLSATCMQKEVSDRDSRRHQGHFSQKGLHHYNLRQWCGHRAADQAVWQPARISQGALQTPSHAYQTCLHKTNAILAWQVKQLHCLRRLC